MKIAVVGTGYVGLPTGAVLADIGHSVVCIDRDASKIERIRNAQAPIFEPGLNELLQKVIASGRLQVSTSIAEGIEGAQVVFIAVGTPPLPDGQPDVSQVVGAAQEIAKCASSPVVVVNKSTVPVGTGTLVAQVLQKESADPSLFSVVSNPEFLREGSAVKDSYSPDRIVIGADDKRAADVLIELYRPLDSEVFVTDVMSAELIKYASNSFLATKISFINAISRICELCGADVADVAHGMGMDRRIGAEFLKAGLGWGGSCFPKDVDGLMTTSRALGYDFGLLRESSKINDEQVANFVSVIESCMGGLDGKSVCVLGLAFKPNTDDVRDAKSIDVIEALRSKGAEVSVFDPVAMPNAKPLLQGVCFAKDEYDAAKDADAIVLVTEWGQFKLIDFVRLGAQMRSKNLFDGRRALDRDKVVGAGFRYWCIGSKPDLE